MRIRFGARTWRLDFLSGQLAKPPAGQQVINRPDQILHVNNQHWPAVFKYRRAINIGHFSQSCIKRGHAEVALTQEPFDDHAKAMAAIAGYHHG